MGLSITRPGKSQLQPYPTVVVQELHLMERNLGGREAVVGLLMLAPLTPDLRYLVGILGDPINRARSLAEICQLAGILPGEILTQLGQAALLKGRVLAGQTVAAGIQAVAADVMRRAAPYEDACHGCRGVGTVTPEPTKDQPNPGPEPCETCLGTGKLTYQPDLERQKLAIEMAQLLPKGGGIQIAQINQGGGGSQAVGRGAHAEVLQKLTDKLLYDAAPRAGSSTPLEAEVVEAADRPAEADPPPDPDPSDV